MRKISSNVLKKSTTRNSEVLIIFFLIFSLDARYVHARWQMTVDYQVASRAVTLAGAINDLLKISQKKKNLMSSSSYSNSTTSTSPAPFSRAIEPITLDSAHLIHGIIKGIPKKYNSPPKVNFSHLNGFLQNWKKKNEQSSSERTNTAEKSTGENDKGSSSSTSGTPPDSAPLSAAILTPIIKFIITADFYMKTLHSRKSDKNFGKKFDHQGRTITTPVTVKSNNNLNTNAPSSSSSSSPSSSSPPPPSFQMNQVNTSILEKNVTLETTLSNMVKRPQVPKKLFSQIF